MRRLSTAELRAERDRLAALRAECPPDRSRELRLATQRAHEAEQAASRPAPDQTTVVRPVYLADVGGGVKIPPRLPTFG